MVAVRRKKTSKQALSLFETKLQSAAFPRISSNYRRRMWLLMFVADMLGFCLAVTAMLLVNQIAPLFRPDLDDLKYLVVVLLCWGFLVTSRLYPGVGVNPADELRLVTQSISLGILIGLAIFTVFDLGWVANSFAFGFAWLGAISSITICRWGIKILAARLNIWGEPVIAIGKASEARELTAYFQKRRRLGLIPVGAVPNLSALNGSSEKYYLEKGIHTVVVTNLFSFSPEASVTSSLFRMFKNVIFVSGDLFTGVSVQLRDFEGLLGIEAKGNIPSPISFFLKRLIDIGLAVLLSVAVLPICIFVALFVWLEDRGPVLYPQKRVGLNGRKFTMFKFRTMVVNAEQKLEDFLETSPKARIEWERDQKLYKDPRITKIGKWLRKWSLDELPQILNVLRGEMSFVGPRPILEEQVPLYGRQVITYYIMRPGITGMWQVSGRSNTSFEERAKFDEYYVRSWTIWLDLYILLRTIWVVAVTEGAR